MLAGVVGLHRQVESIFSKREPQFPEQFPNQMFATHVVGAMAELVVAKELGVEWTGHINHFAQPDLYVIKDGKRIGVEVRYTPLRADIKVKDSDSDNTLVVGVSGLPPNFNIIGFCKAGSVKQKYKPTSPAPGKPAFFCPEGACWDIEELKMWLKN
jgi:hypothetical protein